MLERKIYIFYILFSFISALFQGISDATTRDTRIIYLLELLDYFLCHSIPSRLLMDKNGNNNYLRVSEREKGRRREENDKIFVLHLTHYNYKMTIMVI